MTALLNNEKKANNKYSSEKLHRTVEPVCQQVLQTATVQFAQELKSRNPLSKVPPVLYNTVVSTERHAANTRHKLFYILLDAAFTLIN
jgi:hypothetical protein